MKPILREMLLALVMGAVVPGVLLSVAVTLQSDEEEEQVLSTAPAYEETISQTVPLTMRLRREDGKVEEMDLDAYLVGVVLAEMPADFEPEALKAQSVVARTYTLRAYTTGGKHGDGSVCTQPGCCQAYISETDYGSRGGTQEHVDKVRDAVYATSGQVLLYGGELIEATYFSCSGGVTEDAEAVWGTDFPYLRSVESPGEENAAHYTDTVSFSCGEFQSLLGVSLQGPPQSWFGPVTYTAGNGVDTMVIGGVAYKGTQLRSLLGLRSTAFSVETTEDAVVIRTKGYGHRVGMSQYGADAMAVSGSTFAQILAYYYPGTELTQWKG